jgi:hypothetical protein
LSRPLIFTTGRRIPATYSTNQGAEKGNLLTFWGLVAPTLPEHVSLGWPPGAGFAEQPDGARERPLQGSLESEDTHRLRVVQQGWS